jgi:hypothetical protein
MELTQINKKMKATTHAHTQKSMSCRGEACLAPTWERPSVVRNISGFVFRIVYVLNNQQKLLGESRETNISRKPFSNSGILEKRVHIE